MAFEDRSSPSAAPSPGVVEGISHSQRVRSPDSPESTRTAPFTCTTITKSIISGNNQQTYISPPTSPSMHPYIIPKVEQQERTFLRITSYALSSPKREKDDDSLSYSPVTTHTYSHSEASTSPPPPSPNNHPEPTIQTLKYSITNILQPDFGRSALMRTKSSPSNRIGFKPYESSTSESKPFGQAPLGSLCQAVSQIGKARTEPVTVLPQSPQTPNLAMIDEPPKTVTNSSTATTGGAEDTKKVPTLWPAWVYCTRYSDRPSSGPRSRRMKKSPTAKPTNEDKRPRTAFSGAQLARLKHEFAENRYLTERRRQQLSGELGLNEAQIKIWFQNKRAKIKKANGQKNPLALQLMAQGLYNHSTMACDEDDMPIPS